MKVERLLIRDFRNIREIDFQPDERLNVFVGLNGQGKTSVLEALGYLATLQSFRGSKSPEVIRWDQQQAEVSCQLASDDWKTELKVRFQRSDVAPIPTGAAPRASGRPSRGSSKAKKLAFINGKPFHSSTQYLSQRFGHVELGFHAVVFNPADQDLVRGDPGTRRSFIDQALAAEDPEYLKAAQRYHRLLEQRNAALKADVRPSRDLLHGFTEPLVQHGAWLTLERLRWIERLSGRLNNMLHQIAPDQPVLRLIYLSNWSPEIEGFSIQNNGLAPPHFTGHGPPPSLEILEQAFWKRLSELEAAEWKAGHSLVGPHRDDWGFFFGNQLLKGHGSQGEVRSALLALKLSEIELFRSRTGHRPVFLLDDFSSELDRKRRSFLFRFLLETDLQTFVSTTEETALVPNGKRYWISNGSIEEHEHAAEPHGSRIERLLGG